ncbi:MAG: MFS transporter, partial [Oscillospiraceae bacterium]
MKKLKSWIVNNKGMSMSMFLFLVLISVAAFGNGLSDGVFGNYFKDAYQVNAAERAFIEFPRELPGLLCALVIAGFSFLGDLRIALIAQILGCVGITALGIFTPSFGVMLIFLFCNSLGMHIFMPLQDSIGMALAEPDKIGMRMGEYASLKTAVSFVAAILVFLGFRFHWFSFKTQVKWIFLISGMVFALAIFISVLLVKQAKKDNVLQIRQKRKFKLIFRYRYRFYYLLTILHGV